MKKKFNLFTNILFVLLLIFLLYKRAPEVISHFKSEGQSATLFSVPTLSGAQFDLSKIEKPVAIVFWATWCAPCRLELSRINKMILKNELKPEDILAVSVGEDSSLVLKVVKDRDYRFLVATDSTYEIANSYRVAGTPTLVLVDQSKKIKWITTGLSPSLEYRLSSFLTKLKY